MTTSTPPRPTARQRTSGPEPGTPTPQAVRRPADRRPIARRIARLLLPAAEAVGGFTSTELIVRLPGSRGARHPDVALVLADTPVDGQVRRPPALVAVVEPSAARSDHPSTWLELGVDVVWRVLDDAIEVWTPSAVTHHTRGQVVALPPRRHADGKAPAVPALAVNALLGLR